MAKTENLHETTIVINREAGNGWPKFREETIRSLWPVPIGILKLSEVNKDPGLIDGVNVIGWGGDGTHGYLSGLMRARSAKTWYWPWDLGSVGDIPKSMGWTRMPNEPAEGYITRMADYRHGVNTEVQTINPGIMTSQDQKRSFIWTAGTGAASWLLHEVENRRGTLNKAERLAAGSIVYLKYLIAGRVIDLRIGDEEKTVWDVNVINPPFGRFGSLTLPDNKGILWTITRPENQNERKRKLILSLLDLATMKMGLKPSGQGVELRKLEPGERVIIYNAGEKLQIDSELKPGGSRAEIELTQQDQKPYTLLRRTGP